MNDDEKRQRIGRAVTAVAELFGRTLSPVSLGAYLAALGGLSAEAVEAACMTAMQNETFMPPPAVIRAAAGALPPLGQAINAWGFVVGAVKFGGSDTMDFEDGAINGTIRALGGWPRICNTEAAELQSFTRKAFIETYQQFLTRNNSDQPPVKGYGNHPRIVKIACPMAGQKALEAVKP